MKLTPILFVERIEKSLPFWVDKIGFTKTVEVPEGDHLGFAILVKDGAEVMLQTWEAVQKDNPNLMSSQQAITTLFIEVENFADIRKRLAGVPVVMEERVTFYHMREIAVREPGGHIVVFAAQEAAPK
jgi:uncharacterized glyoxalase superfamily protein PhnB